MHIKIKGYLHTKNHPAEGRVLAPSDFVVSVRIGSVQVAELTPNRAPTFFTYDESPYAREEREDIISETVAQWFMSRMSEDA